MSRDILWYVLSLFNPCVYSWALGSFFSPELLQLLFLLSAMFWRHSTSRSRKRLPARYLSASHGKVFHTSSPAHGLGHVHIQSGFFSLEHRRNSCHSKIRWSICVWSPLFAMMFDTVATLQETGCNDHKTFINSQRLRDHDIKFA